MARQRHTAEEIINKLREAEIGLAKGMVVAEVCRKLGVTEQTGSVRSQGADGGRDVHPVATGAD